MSDNALRGNVLRHVAQNCGISADATLPIPRGWMFSPYARDEVTTIGNRTERALRV